MSAPQIFDRAARRLRRDRYAGQQSFLDGLVAERLLDRLDAVTRPFRTVRLIGANPALHTALLGRGLEVVVEDCSPTRAALLGGVQAEEDGRDLGLARYDLILAAGTLGTVDDLPGALVLIRRALTPDGLFLGLLPGAPSLPALRQAVVSADAEAGLAVQRFHPLIDARSAGDLLVRAGFTLPVADAETVALAYRAFDTLLADLRHAGATNVLRERRSFERVSRQRLAAAFAAQARDGRVPETLTLVTLTGWAPDPSQPQPAKRGSGQSSLAAVLTPPDGGAVG